MATGSSGNNGCIKGFDFPTDDVLCSYKDNNLDAFNGVHPDHSTLPMSDTEIQKIRIARSMFPPEGSFIQDVASVIENAMKKHTDHVMRSLEGLSARLSQLELYCYNIDKSVGGMQSDLERDLTEADLMLRSLDKHLQEVHRSVQIVKDKQELAETQKELAKLQLLHKESSSAHSSLLNEERSGSSTPSPHNKVETSPDMHGMQLVLPPQPQNAPQSLAYYIPTQLHHVQSDSHYNIPQTQDMSKVGSVPAQTQVPHYQQQWVQQMPHQQQMAPLQPCLRTQVSPQLTPVYSSQPVNPTPESLPNSRPMQMPYVAVSQPAAGHVEAPSYVYVGPNKTMQPQVPPQQPQHVYMVYEDESGRPHISLQPQQSQFPQGGYPPTGASLQGPTRVSQGGWSG